MAPLLLFTISGVSCFLFPAIHGVGVTQLLALVSNGRELSLFICCGTDNAMLLGPICSLGPGLSLFQLCDATNAKSECLFWSAASLPADELRVRQGFGSSTCVCSSCAGLLGVTPGWDSVRERSTQGTAG